MKVKYFLVGLVMSGYIIYKRLKYRKPVKSMENDAKKVQ